MIKRYNFGCLMRNKRKEKNVKPFMKKFQHSSSIEIFEIPANAPPETIRQKSFEFLQQAKDDISTSIESAENRLQELYDTSYATATEITTDLKETMQKTFAKITDLKKEAEEKGQQACLQKDKKELLTFIADFYKNAPKNVVNINKLIEETKLKIREIEEEFSKESEQFEKELDGCLEDLSCFGRSIESVERSAKDKLVTIGDYFTGAEDKVSESLEIVRGWMEENYVNLTEKAQEIVDSAEKCVEKREGGETKSEL